MIKQFFYFLLLKGFFFIIINIFFISAKTISLLDLPKIISNNSTLVKKKKIDLQIRKINSKKIFLDYFPNWILNYGYDFTHNLIEKNAQLRPKQEYTLISRLPLLKGGKRFFELGYNNLHYQNEKKNLKQSYETDLKKSIEAYLKTVENYFSLQIAKSNEASSKLQYQFTLNKKRGGQSSEIDLLQAKARYDNDIYLLETEKINYENSIYSLKKKLNLNPLEINPNLNFYLTLKLSKIIEEDSIKKKYQIFSAIKLENENKILNLMNRQNYFERFFPEISLDLALTTFQVREQTINTPTNQIKITNKSEYNFYFGASFTFPFFERFNHFLEIKKNKLMIKKNKFSLEEIYRNFLISFRQTTKLHNNKIDLIQVASYRLESALANRNKTLNSHQSGISSLLQVQEAENLFREAQLDFINLKLEILSLKAEVGHLIGNTMAYLSLEKSLQQIEE